MRPEELSPLSLSSPAEMSTNPKARFARRARVPSRAAQRVPACVEYVQETNGLAGLNGNRALGSVRAIPRVSAQRARARARACVSLIIHAARPPRPSRTVARPRGDPPLRASRARDGCAAGHPSVRYRTGQDGTRGAGKGREGTRGIPGAESHGVKCLTLTGRNHRADAGLRELTRARRRPTTTTCGLSR